MGNKKINKVINMTGSSPVIDIASGGYLDTSNALGFLLDKLSKRSLKKRQKILVTVSNIRENQDNPLRYNQQKVYTYGYLLNYYKGFDGRSSPSAEDLHKIGDKRSAWTPYVMYKQIQHAQKEEAVYNKALDECGSDEGKRAALKEKRRRETSGAQLYIG